jgi:hypothetical protein
VRWWARLGGQPEFVACGSEPTGPAAFDVVAEASFAVVADGDRGGRPLTAELTGAAEAPGPGDPDGSGSAIVALNQGQEMVCFEITVADIATPTASHIHRAPAGVPGGVVVNFNVAANGLSGCVQVDAALIKDIRQHPSAYYVNVHNADHPPGAVRGRMAK